MKKCYICTVLYCTVLYCTVLYCTVLYWSIDVLCCDCCRKLCGKSVDKSKKTKWKFLELEEYNTQKKRANAWRNWLAKHAHQDDVVVPVVFEQHNKKKGCVLTETGEAMMISIPKNINVQAMYNKIFKEAKIKSFVLYFNGDPNLKYDGTQTPLGGKLISDDSLLFNKESDDPILKRAIFISYYAEIDNNNILA